LSYTSFAYSNLSLSSPQVGSDGTVKIHVDVKNTGDRAGDEVVQLYVHNNDKTITQPREQLQGFERISLNPGETKTMDFTLPVEQLSFWDTGKHAYVIHPGTFDVMVGSASDDIRQKGSFEVTKAGEWPPTTLTTQDADGDYARAGQE
jgi:beta-glucosidase